MLLNAEIKDDHYVELPRQAETQDTYPAAKYLKADASTGQHYIDLNAAAKGYSGAWLFGKQHVEATFSGMRGQWIQWCPIPAGINDGVMLRGNVIYQNGDGSYRTSNDMYEGVIRTEGGTRVFEGRTQHTFISRNVPGGSMQVVANLHIPLTQQLPYNPMIQLPDRQMANAARYSGAQAQSYTPVQGYPPVQGYGGGGGYGGSGYGAQQGEQQTYAQSSEAVPYANNSQPQYPPPQQSYQPPADYVPQRRFSASPAYSQQAPQSQESDGGF